MIQNVSLDIGTTELRSAVCLLFLNNWLSFHNSKYIAILHSSKIIHSTHIHTHTHTHTHTPSDNYSLIQAKG